MPGGMHAPVEQWLSWPAPNYVDPPTKPKYVLVFSCLLGPISTLLLFARLWIRVRVQRSPGWDDWLILVSWFCLMALTVIFPLLTEKFYFNRHLWDIEYKYYPIQRHYVMAIYALFSLASGLIKISVLLFYRRLGSRAVSPAFRWTLRITIAVIGIYTIVFVSITMFMCTPISAFWNQINMKLLLTGYKYRCANEGAEIVANGIISTIQDVVVASLPAVLCWNLQMRTRQKIALYSVFAVSYSAAALGTLRTITSYRSFFVTYDTTWTGCDVWLWSLLELHVGFACANTPAVKAFYRHYFPSERTLPSSSSRPSHLGSQSFWKRNTNPRSSAGYLSEAHTSQQGAIVQMDARYNSHERRPGTTKTVIQGDGHAFKSEIEMGKIFSYTDISVTGGRVQVLARPEPVKGWDTWLKGY
ncbi:hypothetical protein EKO04_001498 [Ascochyta lentis]|uniref:Rhodopsin domain-containing protein n=1 Tax=Ascochyta lentis TaxID=205686 RepID=A0A8H7MMB4_9PLEO|nr:hypothetical protein EKO04_001498 [Ascochyta lentis]